MNGLRMKKGPAGLIGRVSGRLLCQEPAAGAGRGGRRRLRSRRADEHLLQPARDGRDGDAAHAPRGARGRAHPLRLRAPLEERAAFRQLIRISGVGARTALSVLSGLSVADLAQAVALQDAARLTKVPGHRQEDGRAAAARVEGQARRRAARRRAAGRRRTTCSMRCSAWATARRRRSPRSRACRRALAVSEGIRAALKALAKS